MTAENEVPEVRKVEVEDKCEDLTNVGGDCNVKQLKEEGEPEGAKLNSNGAGKDDSDGSYVFVSRSDDSANGDTADLSLDDGQESPTREYLVNSLTKRIEQVGELNDESRESASEEVKATDSTVVKANADDADNFDAKDQNAEKVEFEQIDTEGTVKEQIVPDLAPEREENLDTQGGVEDQSEENIESEQLDAGVAVKEQIVPDLAPEKEENFDAESAGKESMVSDSAPEIEENLQAPIGVDDGKTEPEGLIAQSETIPELEKVSESGEQASSESTSKLGEIEEKMEPEGFSANPELTSELEKVSESVDPASSEPTLRSGEVEESPRTSLEVGDLHNGVEKPQEQNNLELAVHSQESEKTEDSVSKASEYPSPLLDDSTKVVKEHQANQDISSGLEECEETQDIVSDSTECNHSSFKVEKVIEEKEILSEASIDLEQNLESRISGQESVEVESCQRIDGEGKLAGEEKEDTITDTKGTEAAVNENINGAADHVSGAGEVASVVDVPPETEIVNDLVPENNEDSNPTAQVEKTISLAEVQNECIIVSEDSSALIDSPNCVENLPSSEILTVENLQPCHVMDTVIDGEVGKLDEEVKSDAGIDVKESSSKDDVILNTSGVENGGNESAKLPHIEGVLRGTEMTDEHVLDKNDDSFPPSQVEGTRELTDVLITPISGSQSTSVSIGSIDNGETVHSSTDLKSSEIELGGDAQENVFPSSRTDTEVKNADGGGDEVSQSCDSAANIEVDPVDAEEEVTDLNCAEAISSNEFPTAVNATCSQSQRDDGLHPEKLANESLQSGDSAELEHEVNSPSSISGKETPSKEASEILDDTAKSCTSTAICVPDAMNVEDAEPQVGPGGAKDKEKLMWQDEDVAEQPNPEEISSSLEVASVDVLDEQRVADKVLQKPFNYLVKLPRYDDDDNLREQIRLAQLQVDEKTQKRDAIRLEVQRIKETCQSLYECYEAAIAQGRSARFAVKSKRQEIESVQTVINRVKNAMSVEDIDVRIRGMEHMMQHDTLLLKEEKQFIREIKQLRQLREQLSSNMGSQEEVRQAIEQRDQIEEQLKVLKKELEGLKAQALNADTAAKDAEKKCKDESVNLKDLHNKFRDMDNQRQEAYVHFQNLKRQFYEKNSRFRMYKDDAARANDFAMRGDNEALYNHCFRQVEEVVGLWNKDEEFRNEYIRCNTRSTLRRFRTLDGRALGPDEESPVFPSAVDERTDRSISTPVQADSVLVVPTVEQEKQVINVKVQEKGSKPDKPKEKVAEPLKRSMETKKPANTKPAPSNVSPDVSASGATEELSEEDKKRKEEEEKAKKEEIMRKEEEAAKLKEQRRLEEIAKAKEALERKRRHAEKAQIRAQLRAQKEAEEKEKEKEKRARKKGKKKGVAGESADGDSERDIAPVPESTVSASKEPEAKKEAPKPVTKRPNHFTKPKATIPPPLRNRNKKKMQQYLWMAAAVAAVIAVFLVGNMGFYSNFGKNLRMKPPSF